MPLPRSLSRNPGQSAMSDSAKVLRKRRFSTRRGASSLSRKPSVVCRRKASDCSSIFRSTSRLTINSSQGRPARSGCATRVNERGTFQSAPVRPMKRGITSRYFPASSGGDAGGSIVSMNFPSFSAPTASVGRGWARLRSRDRRRAQPKTFRATHLCAARPRLAPVGVARVLGPLLQPLQAGAELAGERTGSALTQRQGTILGSGSS